MRRLLLVTNDFPPRAGGIQSFVYELARRQDPQALLVLASHEPGDEAFDATLPFPVIRFPRYPMLPTRKVGSLVASIVREYECETVWFGAMAPLGLLASTARSAGVRRCIAMTHGHEAAWAMLPGARSVLRRIARQMDIVTYLGDYTRRHLDPVIGELTTMEHLPPGVDTEVYHPGVDGKSVRTAYGLDGRAVIVCVSRLVPRKGQDMLIRSLPLIQEITPTAALMLVGGGRDRKRLERLARRTGVMGDVVFTGSVPSPELPRFYAAGDVFAMPCRTRRGGLDVEGLGIVYLEASACGLPVIAGDSGGAPDAVRDGVTGLVVDGRERKHVASAIVSVLSNSERARSMGRAGRDWVENSWRWDVLARRLEKLAKLPKTDTPGQTLE